MSVLESIENRVNQITPNSKARLGRWFKRY